jgi:two-component system phosphate regulon response regulator PhoB
MPKATILAIEDDPDIVEVVRYNLAREGFRVLVAGDGEKGLAEARRARPELVLLDLMLPGIDGLEVCKRMRADEALSATPIVMVTAKSEESDVVVGLEMGADDYLTKPFSPRELVARVRAVLRRAARNESSRGMIRIEHAGLVLDLARHEATFEARTLDLTRAEFRLLWALARKPGRVFERDELADEITAGESIITDRNVDVHVSSIRKKLGPAGDLIATVRGVGYKCRD